MADQERDKDKQLIQWLNKELTDKDLERSLPKEEVSAYKQIIEEIDQWVPDNDRVVFDPGEVTRKAAAEKEKFRKSNPWIPVSIAASFLVASFAIWYYFELNKTSYYAGTGETREIILPDGNSRVILSSGSKVSWGKEDWSETSRTLSLEGRAFFDIVSGSPFSVSSGNGKIDVLGTRFEVDEFNQSLLVSCYEGKVRVTSPDNQSVILNRGEKSLYHQGYWEEKMTLEDEEPSWMSENITKFDNAPMPQVLNSIERIFGVNIDSNAINSDRRYTGSFPNNDLDVALRLVTSSLGISYRVDGKTVVLSE